ncbi:MAG: type III-B CRISPR module-associated protein Cmr5 [Methanotrichaceae archaeon]|nr:type III-B CRISPR module-associated protein Cmr5 [Methanotrichaceae archaeon]
MVRTTKQQVRAKKAYECFLPEKNVGDEYRQFAKRFPALVHSCGLAQAVAFAQAKEKNDYLNDLAKVMGITNSQILGKLSRTIDLVEYQQKTREAIECATWIKRYAEATEEISTTPKESPEK